MRFIVKQTGRGSERVGNIIITKSSQNVVLETPTASLFTQGGSVVHLTAEVLSQVFPNPQLLWVPLSNSVHLENGVKAQNEGVAKFAGLPNHITCTSFQNMSEITPSGHFELNKVPLWTKNGKKMMTADRYMDLMEVFKPDIILAVADGRTSLEEGYKRTLKSVDRSNNLLNSCVERFKSSKVLQESALVGVIVGAVHSKKCNESIKHTLSHIQNISGIALAGITDGSDESYKVPTEEVAAVFKKVGEAIPNHLFRIVEGCWNLEIILTAIEHGWDVFDGSYPLLLTNLGYALKLNFDVTKEECETKFLDLSDEKYKEDFRPILEDCECLACKKHTRAYIRHLLNTREMLSSVLLSIHNLHHFDQMFLHARRHIAASTFNVYKQHIIEQCKDFKTLGLSRCKESEKDRCKNSELDRYRPLVQDSVIKKKRVSEEIVDCNEVLKMNGSET